MTQKRIKILLEALNQPMATARAIGLVLVRVEDTFVPLRSGKLSEGGFQAVVGALKRHWLGSANRDLNRYVGLYLDNAFYLLYAKFLPQGDYLLGLIFPSQTPLIRIRQDMTDFMRAILEDGQGHKDAQKPLNRSIQFVLKPYPQPDPGLRDALGQGDQFTAVAVKDEASAKMAEWVHPFRQVEIEKGETQQDLISLRKSLSPRQEEVPVEEKLLDLDEIRAESPWLRIDVGWPIAGIDDRDIKNSLDEENPNLVEKSHHWQPLDEVSNHEEDLVSIFQEDFELRDAAAGLNAWMIPEDIPEVRPNITLKESGETAKPHIADIKEMSDELAVSDISFYLVPNLDEHSLLDEIAHQLRLWLPVICEKYGWQLGLLVLQPDYLKWTLQDFPEILINEMLQIVRKETSERIFKVFPNLRASIIGEDFWAQGYLVDRQNREFSTQELMSHISKSRLGEP